MPRRSSSAAAASPAAPPPAMTTGSPTPLSPLARSRYRVAQDLDHLLGALGRRHRGPVDLLERVREVVVVQGDEGLTERRRVPGLEGRVPLAVLVAEADDDHVGAAQQRLRAHGVDTGALVVLPEPLLLGAEDVD